MDSLKIQQMLLALSDDDENGKLSYDETEQRKQEIQKLVPGFIVTRWHDYAIYVLWPVRRDSKMKTTLEVRKYLLKVRQGTVEYPSIFRPQLDPWSTPKHPTVVAIQKTLVLLRETDTLAVLVEGLKQCREKAMKRDKAYIQEISLDQLAPGQHVSYLQELADCYGYIIAEIEKGED